MVIPYIDKMHGPRTFSKTCGNTLDWSRCLFQWGELVAPSGSLLHNTCFYFLKNDLLKDLFLNGVYVITV